jgi:glycosyltransferase involved in cell wall biosynthesis
MKVLHIGKYYPPHMGGMETHLQHLAEGLQKHVDVQIIVANDFFRTDRSWVDGLHITRVATLGEFSSSALTWGLSREIAESEADIVHLHAPNPLAMHAFLRSGHKGKLVITHQADITGRRFLKKLIWPVWRRCMDRASAIIVSSRTFAESSEELGPYRDKWRIIPMGIDFAFLDNISDQEIKAIRTKYAGQLVLFVGRLVPYKGLHFLIAAMQDMDATLLIIGEGPEQDRLQALAAKHRCRSVFLGRVPSLGAYYRSADLFVLSSCEPKEAFGLVQLEAMHCGLPVVNTSLPTSVPEVSVHGLTGLTVKPGNVKELNQAISSLLADTRQRVLFSGNARRRAAEFGVASMTEEMLNCYSRVLNEQPMSRIKSSVHVTS